MDILDANWDQDDLDNAAAGSKPATTQKGTKITKKDDPIGEKILEHVNQVKFNAIFRIINTF